MSYTPTEWATGDVITADKLNNMESGIVGAGLIFELNLIQTDDTHARLSMTWGEIKSLAQNHKVPLLFVGVSQDQLISPAYSLCEGIQINTDGGGAIYFRISSEPLPFEADTDDDYPVTSVGNQ